MKKLEYTIKINRSAEHVHKVMLDKETYKLWTTAFDPSSDFEGSWDKGSTIIFTAMREGKKEGMVARIEENEPGKYVSIRHLGLLEDNKQITDGPKVEGWAGALENYTFTEENGITTVRVEVDTLENYIQFFDQAWPKALNKLKEVSEK